MSHFCQIFGFLPPIETHFPRQCPPNLVSPLDVIEVRDFLRSRFVLFPVPWLSVHAAILVFPFFLVHHLNSLYKIMSNIVFSEVASAFKSEVGQQPTRKTKMRGKNEENLRKKKYEKLRENEERLRKCSNLANLARPGVRISVNFDHKWLCQVPRQGPTDRRYHNGLQQGLRCGSTSKTSAETWPLRYFRTDPYMDF